jgi:hypothetical protein
MIKFNLIKSFPLSIKSINSITEKVNRNSQLTMTPQQFESIELQLTLCSAIMEIRQAIRAITFSLLLTLFSILMLIFF